MNIKYEIPPKFSSGFASIDLEIFGLNENQLHRPTSGVFACASIAHESDPETAYILTEEKQIQGALDNLEHCVHVFQYGTFDVVHLRRWAKYPPRKKFWDTYLVERIMYGGYYDKFALDDLIRRHLGEYRDKSLQKSFSDATELSREQIQYAAHDAIDTLKVALSQKKQIDKDSFNVWKKIDLPALWAFLDFQGFRLDVDAWKALAKHNEQMEQELDESFDFNPRSPKQVKEKLQKLGWKSLKSTAVGELEKRSSKNPESDPALLANKILEYRKYKKRASTYGMNFVEDYLESELDYHVIHSNYNVVGAKTGRTSSSNPNLQNIIARDTDAYRNCFLARPGNKLVVIDYSANEPRFLAYKCQEPWMIDIFNSDRDIYIALAKDVFGEEIDKKSPRRNDMKAIILGTDYGMSEYGLAKKLGCSKDEAAEFFRIMFKKLPNLADYMHEQRTKTTYVTTVGGRKSWLNPYSAQCERNALNSPIQGSAADLLKLSLNLLHQRWPTDLRFGVVGQVHDEIIIDSPAISIREVSEFAEKCMMEAGEILCPTIPFPAKPIICDKWGEAK